jgi:hypothetical protein
MKVLYKKQDPDWSILEDRQIMDVATSTVRAFVNDYNGKYEYDDMFQEASIILATRSSTFYEAMNGGHRSPEGILATRLRQDLSNLVCTDVRRGDWIQPRGQFTDSGWVG